MSSLRLGGLGKKITQLILLACVLSGCGYTTRSMIGSKYHTIYVGPFLNKVDITTETYTENKYRIYRPLLETDVTKAVIDRYLWDGNLRPVKEDLADVALRGELVEFRRDPLRYTESNEVEEYRISIVVNISLWDTKEKKAVWEENGFTGETTYFTSFSANSTKKSEDLAVRDALTDLGRRIVERTVEQW